jgi:hypothetical protein
LTESIEPRKFTSEDFTTVLKEADVAISIDGVGRAIGNVFIERLWQTQIRPHLFEPRGERNYLSRRHRHVLALLQRRAPALIAR